MLHHHRSLQKAATLALGFICITYLLTNHKQLAPSLLNIAQIQGLRSNANSSDKGVSKSHLHLLIPATSSNDHLCRLLLSAAVLNYPVPTIINWGASEDGDPFAQHLAKIKGIHNHLQTFSPSKKDDLLLIVDGYDSWFQLGPDVLIRRYLAVKQALDCRVALDFDPYVAKEHDLRNTVIFGSDKLCWPRGGGRRPACWAIPQSPLPANSFGNFDDHEVDHASENAVRSRPRWLNSGTVMGDLGEVRAVFEAAVARINTSHTSDSDQFYLANLFGDQEYARSLLKQDSGLPPSKSVETPSFEPGKKNEFHIGLDYWSTLFQNVGYYDRFISWLWFDGPRGGKKRLEGGHPTIPHGFALPDDIAASRPPSLAERKSCWVSNDEANKDQIQCATSRLPSDLSWRDMPLATNIVTGQTSVLMHFTFEKELRDAWWGKMWFYPYARQLLSASSEIPKAPILDMPIDDQLWWNTEVSHLANSGQIEKFKKDERSGAWGDTGMWLPWDELCRPFDEAVFGPSVH